MRKENPRADCGVGDAGQDPSKAIPGVERFESATKPACTGYSWVEAGLAKLIFTAYKLSYQAKIHRTAQ